MYIDKIIKATANNKLPHNGKPNISNAIFNILLLNVGILILRKSVSSNMLFAILSGLPILLITSSSVNPFSI